MEMMVMGGGFSSDDEHDYDVDRMTVSFKILQGEIVEAYGKIRVNTPFW
jgi:hypothetical protein